MTILEEITKRMSIAYPPKSYPPGYSLQMHRQSQSMAARQRAAERASPPVDLERSLPIPFSTQSQMPPYNLPEVGPGYGTLRGQRSTGRPNLPRPRVRDGRTWGTTRNIGDLPSVKGIGSGPRTMIFPQVGTGWQFPVLSWLRGIGR